MSSVLARPRRATAALVLVAALAALTACTSTPAAPATPSDRSTSATPATPSDTSTSRTPGPSSPTSPPAGTVPRPDHVVVVLFENKGAGSIIGNPDAPYLNTLADGGATMTQSYAVSHPSQPNYIALFSGSTHKVKDDACTYTFKANNQAHEMLATGLSFMSYAEDLPAAGSKVCSSGKYARKHAPWTDFKNVPPRVQQPFTSFPTDYTSLPDVSWVVPNLCNDMHDCSIDTGDRWLETNLGPYARWAIDHNSLLVVTFDEDDSTGDNQIATVFYGGPVARGSYDEHITHYNVLRTMEDMYGVRPLGKAKKAAPITDIWR